MKNLVTIDGVDMSLSDLGIDPNEVAARGLRPISTIPSIASISIPTELPQRYVDTTERDFFEMGRFGDLLNEYVSSGAVMADLETAKAKVGELYAQAMAERPQ